MIITAVVSRHAEEAAFLWLTRNHAVHAPHYDLADLAKLDSRIEAHMDGLRVAGDPAWELCREALTRPDPGELFAASVLAFENGRSDQIDQVLALGASSVPLSRGVVSALGWLTFRKAKTAIDNLLANPTWSIKAIGVAAAAVHRSWPEIVTKALASREAWVLARACRAVGELGLNEHGNTLHDLLKSDDHCRFWASWSATLLAPDRDARTVLSSYVDSDGEKAVKALDMIVRRDEINAARKLIEQLAEKPDRVRLAFMAVAALGDPHFVPWLIQQMSQPPLARLAGEAFTMLAGVDLARERLVSPRPEGFESGPTEDPNDENVEMDPDERLPWPNPVAVENWWHQHQSEFTPGIRYLLGKPLTLDWLEQVLRKGRQRQRVSAALELSILQPGRALFNVKAPGFRQQRLLAHD